MSPAAHSRPQPRGVSPGVAGLTLSGKLRSPQQRMDFEPVHFIQNGKQDGEEPRRLLGNAGAPGAHARNESVLISELVRRTALLARLTEEV